MYTFHPRRNRDNRQPAIMMIAVALTVVLLVLFGMYFPSFTAPATQSLWQQATQQATLLAMMVLISLWLAGLSPRSYVLTAIAAVLATLSLYLASVVILCTQHAVFLAGLAPLFVLCTFFVSSPRWQTLLQRLAGGGAIVLFFVLLYLTALTNLWWVLVIICLVTCLSLFVLQRFIVIRRHYMRRQFNRNSCLLTMGMVVAAIAVGLKPSQAFQQQTSLNITQPIFNVTTIISFIAMMVSVRLNSHQCVTIWNSTVCVMLLLSLLLSPFSSLTLLLAVLSICMAIAAWGLSRLAVAPLPVENVQINYYIDNRHEDIDEEYENVDDDYDDL